MLLSRFCPANPWGISSAITGYLSPFGQLAPQSSIIHRYIIPQKKRNSFLPCCPFQEDEIISWKLPRMSIMSFWLQQGDMPTSKSVTRRTGTTTNGFSHSWFTLGLTVEGQTLGLYQQGRKEKWLLDRPSTVLTLLVLRDSAWFPTKPTPLSLFQGTSINQENTFLLRKLCQALTG